MAPIKLLSSDLDGTIIFDRAIGPDSIQAIHQWQQAGNIAVCSTGKSIEATRFALRDSGLEFDYNVLYTGAVVTDKHYNVLMSHTLPSALVSELVQKLSEEQGISVFATTLDTNDVRLYSSIPPELSTDILQYFDPLKYEDIPHHTFVGIPIWVSAGYETEKTIQRLHTWILDTYGDVLDCHRNQDFLDIVPPNCTKATGLAWLMKHLRSTTSATYETYSLGDSWNDIDMHHWADHSVSFPHSPAEIQELTETVAPTAADYIQSVLAHE